MSIFNYLFDSEWSQRSDIEHLKRRAASQQRKASHSARSTQKKVKNLEEEVEALKDEIGALQLISRSLLETLRHTEGWDDSKFQKVLMDIDLEDGQLDGKA